MQDTEISLKFISKIWLKRKNKVIQNSFQFKNIGIFKNESSNLAKIEQVLIIIMSIENIIISIVVSNIDSKIRICIMLFTIDIEILTKLIHQKKVLLKFKKSFFFTSFL